MTQHLLGTIHGKTIELQDDPGFEDGQAVVVAVQPAPTNSKYSKPWGAGIIASAGAFADDPNAEKLIEEILQQRKQDFGREIPE